MPLWTPIKCEDNLNCTIPLNELKSNPYNFEVNETILMRVKAKNEVGWGPYSEVTEIEYVLEQIPRMEPPVLDSENDTLVSITWEAVADKYEIIYTNDPASGYAIE